MIYHVYITITFFSLFYVKYNIYYRIKLYNKKIVILNIKLNLIFINFNEI